MKKTYFLTVVTLLVAGFSFGSALATAAPTVNMESVTVTEPTNFIYFGSVEIPIKLSEPSEQTCSASVKVIEGTAKNGRDYYVSPLTQLEVEFEPGTVEQKIDLGLINDALSETAETFTVEFSDTTNCVAGDEATVTILDDGDPVEYGPLVNVSEAFVDESQRIGRVSFTLSEPVTRNCRVSLLTEAETAQPVTGRGTGGVDFMGINRSTYLLEPGILRYEFVFQVLPDDIVEQNESFRVIAAPIQSCARGGSAGRVTIIDDDGPTSDPVVTVASKTFSEGETAVATVDVILSQSPTVPVTVTLASRGESAVAGSDYIDATRTLTFAPGSSTTQQVSFEILNDQVFEQPETFVVEVIESDNATVGNAAQITLVDDDDPNLLPVLYLEGNTVNVFESAGVARVRLLLDRPAERDCAAFISPRELDRRELDSDREVAATQLLDFGIGGRNVVMPQGDTEVTVEISIIQDSEQEPLPESFNVDMKVTSAGCRGDGGVNDGGGTRVTIFDDDVGQAGVQDLLISNNTITEGVDSEVSVTLSIPSALSSPLTVPVRSRQGNAVSGEDYLGLPLETVIDAGETSKTVSYKLINDERLEPLEFFTVAVVDSDNRFRNLPPGMVLINDDDRGGGSADPQPIAAVGSTTVTEGADAEASVAVTLSQSSDQIVTVEVDAVAGTASAGDDFIAATETVVFAPGEQSKLVSFSIINDDVEENTETFAVGIVRAENARSGGGGEITIRDDDGDDDDDTNLPRLDIGDTSVTEGTDPVAVVVLRLSRASNTPTTVEVASRQREAISGPDYLGRNYNVVFAPGETAKTVSWGIVDDTEAEPSETFVVVPVRLDGAIEGASGTVFITDDDGGDEGPIRLDIGNASVTEGRDSEASVELRLSQASRTPVTVEVASRQRDAISGPDYLGRNYTVTFAPGETVKNVSWGIVDDTEVEETETFVVVPVNLQGAGEGSIGTVTIKDDDAGGGRPRLDIGDSTVTEGSDTRASVELRLSQTSSTPVTVEVASRQREAISGPDYLGRNYVVVFAPGETVKTVSWGIVDDSVVETAETFVVVPVSISGATEGRTGTVTINDNDARN